MQITLIRAAPVGGIAGAHAYNRRMLAGLAAAGHQVSMIELPGAHPVTDEAARSAARGAWASLPRDTLPIVDGLALPAFAGQGDSLASRPAVALIHHPTALGAGVSESERATLRNTELRLLPRFTRVIATSRPTAERLTADFGVDTTRLRVVEPGTDPAARSVGSGGTGCTILSIGALVPRKGHDVLIRAVARLFDLDWRLTIVGATWRDPACTAAIEALAAEPRVEGKIRLAGEVDDAALEALWHEADLFALASLWEGYGTTVAEALRHGLPVAVTADGAAAALVPTEAGVVCPAGDVEQWSKALRRVIFGSGLRGHMAEVAWAAGQGLPGWEQQVAAFEAAVGGEGR